MVRCNNLNSTLKKLLVKHFYEIVCVMMMRRIISIQIKMLGRFGGCDARSCVIEHECAGALFKQVLRFALAPRTKCLIAWLVLE
jgi:hypothetical protein